MNREPKPIPGYWALFNDPLGIGKTLTTNLLRRDNSHDV